MNAFQTITIAVTAIVVGSVIGCARPAQTQAASKVNLAPVEKSNAPVLGRTFVFEPVTIVADRTSAPVLGRSFVFEPVTVVVARSPAAIAAR